jgi:acetoacetyl-CoA synthetase
MSTRSDESISVQEGELLWTPRPQFAAESKLAAFQAWLADRGVPTGDYAALWHWSVSEPDAFWTAIWNYFDIIHDGSYVRAMSSLDMLGVRWFDGARVNYAEHLLRPERTASANKIALHHSSEIRPLSSTTWSTLGSQVRILATQLRAMGVKPGDRVVSYMPNVPETAIAMMATVAVGAVWSSAAIEFGVRTVVERFAQIEPKVIFAADGYMFGGKVYTREAEMRQIIAELPTLEQVIWLPYLESSAVAPEGMSVVTWEQIMDRDAVPPHAFRFERVTCDHPIWIVFSSGTTGLPKPIVHSHVGVLLEHIKLMHFHINLGPDSVMFFYSTTGWMMWNILLAALLTGSAAVLYDGSPVHPAPDLLWRLAASTRTTSFGASPTFIQMMKSAGVKPRETFDLSLLESIVVSGAPSSPETFAWLYRHVKRDLWVTSQSGGTEICSGFVGAVPLLPVYAGEIQARLLGMDVHVWNDRGREVVDEVGELVVTRPFPSMPVAFWNDPGDVRYRESYFEYFAGVWRHGDFIKINERGGCYIYGRSDSTLNRYGVRIGSAEVYRAIERIPEIADSLIVCCELPGAGYFMPLFLKLKEADGLDQALRDKVAAVLRHDCSPRHVPDQMYAVDLIPYTLTGKKMEVPVRKILMGWPVEKAASRDSMMNPEALEFFIRFAQESIDYQWRTAGGRGLAPTPVADIHKDSKT